MEFEPINSEPTVAPLGCHRRVFWDMSAGTMWAYGRAGDGATPARSPIGSSLINVRSIRSASTQSGSQW